MLAKRQTDTSALCGHERGAVSVSCTMNDAVSRVYRQTDRQTDRLQEGAAGVSILRRASDHVISADDARAIISNGPRGLRWTGLLQRRLVSLLHAACSPQTRRVDGGAAWIYGAGRRGGASNRSPITRAIHSLTHSLTGSVAPLDQLCDC